MFLVKFAAKALLGGIIGGIVGNLIKTRMMREEDEMKLAFYNAERRAKNGLKLD